MLESDGKWMVEVMGQGANYRNVQDLWEGNYKTSLKSVKDALN